MRRLLVMRLTGARFDIGFAWVAGFLLLVACTTLVLKVLPELSLLRSMVLVVAVSAAWLVIGAQARRLRRVR